MFSNQPCPHGWIDSLLRAGWPLAHCITPGIHSPLGPVWWFLALQHNHFDPMYLKYCARVAPEVCFCAAKLRTGLLWRQVVPRKHNTVWEFKTWFKTRTALEGWGIQIWFIPHLGQITEWTIPRTVTRHFLVPKVIQFRAEGDTCSAVWTTTGPVIKLLPALSLCRTYRSLHLWCLQEKGNLKGEVEIYCVVG